MTRATVTTTLKIVENTLPDWLIGANGIAVGERKNVSLNTIYDTNDFQNPDSRLRDVKGILYAWCGTTYAPNYGRYGSILAFGGGHANGICNSVHRFDIESRLWTRISDPSPVAAAGINRADISDSGSTGQPPPPLGWPTDELWGDAERTTLLTGKVAATHTYGMTGYVPPEVTGNINGWLVMVPFRSWPHFVDLDNPSDGWNRLGGHFAEYSSYGYIIIDRIRKRMFAMGSPAGSGSGGMRRLGFLDLQTLNITPIPSSMNTLAYYHVGFHAEADDLYLTARANYPSQEFRLIDPVAQNVITPAQLNVPAAIQALTTSSNGGTWDWVESVRSFVHWIGLPDSTQDILYYLEPTGDARTDPWEWREQTFTGDPAETRDSNSMYKRLHWVEPLGSFFHVARTMGPVQCWRVR